MLQIAFENIDPVKGVEIFADITSILYKSENINEDRIINLTFTESSYMRSINKMYRGVDRSTDVLSFNSDFDLLLGDILIDILTAERQKGSKSLLYEIVILYIHGFLHLAGYDHIHCKDIDVMRAKEKSLLNRITEKYNKELS